MDGRIAAAVLTLAEPRWANAAVDTGKYRRGVVTAMPPDQPNVVVVFTDQHRASAMGCYGDPNVRTPHWDAFAEEGTRFTNAYATDPVCTPNRGCLLTGQYPFNHGVVFNELRLPEDAPTIAKELQTAGYRNGYIGKWHLDGLPRDRWTPPGPRRQGFDDYWAINQSAHDYIDAHYYTDSPEPVEVEGYTPETETDLAMEFMDDHRADHADEPFCLFLAWGPPHSPYGDVPQEYKDLYDPDDIELLPNVEPRKGESPEDRTQEAAIRETLRDYYAHITALDEQFGRLTDYLDETGLAEDTIVLYTSDHGDMHWSHGEQNKGDPWDAAAQVPLLARWPGEIPAEAVSGTIDVTPTLLGLAGESAPAAMDGTDLSATVRGEAAETPDSLYMMRTAIPRMGGEWRAIRTERYTYAELLDGTPWLLYDSETDPYQRTNLVFDPEHAALQADLAERLDEWRERTDDPMLNGVDQVRELGKLDELYESLDLYGWI
jgi:arylsulfatase A-like enzyme